jgi:lipopolysaccharide biosynthesis glycosyltransferase
MDTLVVFVTDGGFLVPSLVAASQLVKQGIHNIADIMIYTVDVDAEILAKLRTDNPHIKFENLPAQLFTPPAHVNFFKNHVPITSLARLSLQEVMNPAYKNIVYIDGDVQIVGDVRALIRCVVPEGKIMAGRGSAWLDDGKDENATPRGYLESLGDVSTADYFNAGILAFSAATWQHKAPEALNFFFENSAACIRHDQSALNAVFNGNVVHFPPKYNFHSKYTELGVQRKYQPAIIHFTGPNKPWGRPAIPWWGQFRKSYREMIRQQPYLSGFLKIDDEAEIKTTLRRAKNYLKQAFKPELKDERTTRFFDYISRTDFPC